MPKITIMDDDAELRSACRLILQSGGYELLQTASHEERLERIEKPDLVILDVLMPRDYGGFKVARQIRENLNMKALPLPLLSALRDIKEAPCRFAPDQTRLPVDAFLDKAASPEMSLSKVHEMLGLDRVTPEESFWR